MAYNPNSVQAEAVAQADAELNNVGLPNTYALAAALSALIQACGDSPGMPHHAPRPAAINAAKLVLSRIAPHLPANV